MSLLDADPAPPAPVIRRSRLCLGQRLALVRRATASLADEADICRRHGLTPSILDAWRADFQRHNIHEVDLAELREARQRAWLTAEENAMLGRLNLLRQALRAKSAEACALHGALRTARTGAMPPIPPR